MFDNRRPCVRGCIYPYRFYNYIRQLVKAEVRMILAAYAAGCYTSTRKSIASIAHPVFTSGVVI
jgi:hypothetical protein